MRTGVEIPRVQFTILCILADSDGERTGEQIRQEMASRKMKRTGPAFYQAMIRMEQAKFVNGKKADIYIDGKKYKQKIYSLSMRGRTVLNNYLETMRVSSGDRVSFKPA